MDVHDIFAKLTRNALFKNNNKTRKQNVDAGEERKVAKIERKEPKFKPEEEVNTHDLNPIKLLGNISSHDDKMQPKRKKRKRSNNKNAVAKTANDTKKLQALEVVRQFRNKHNIKVVGSRIPDPISSFDQLEIAPNLLSNLKICGYNEPTAIQMQAIPVLLQRRQLLACAPTGSGKTIAFLLPLIHTLHVPQQTCRALILCPTRELAKQTHSECTRLAAATKLRIKLIGSTSKAQFNCDVVVSTPQRICRLLGLDSNAINMANVQWVVIDEADKLFEEYGNDEGARSFRYQLTQILDACTHTERRIAMFSATYSPSVAGWCRRETHGGGGMVRVMVGERNTAPELVEQHLLYAGSESGKLLAFRELMRGGLEGLTLKPPVLVFVQSKERAQHLFSELIYDGISVDAVHADRTQQQRDNTTRAFREGKVWVLICTELMARGLDFKGVNLVVNYDLPKSAVAYVHRVGRVGRAGRPGKALTLYTDADRATPGLLRPIAAAMQRSGCEVPPHLLHGSKTMKKRLLRTSQVKRDQIPSKLPLNRKTLPKRERKYSKDNSGGDVSKHRSKKTKRKM